MWTHIKYGIAVIVVVLILGFLYLMHIMANFNGGAGSLMTYEYPVSKYELEKIVDSVLIANDGIYRDSTKSYVLIESATSTRYSLDSTAGATREVDFYNDGIKTLRIHITKGGIHHEYFVRFYGDSTTWDSSDQCEIGITYADGYSRGQKKPSEEIENELLAMFESEFIDKIDKKLGIERTEPEN